jgi:Na+/H+-dicarboxylate symporter
LSGGLIVGLLAYSLAGGAPWIGWIAANVTGPIGQIFLRLLFMLVIPLLVSALIVGVAEMNEMRALKLHRRANPALHHFRFGRFRW